METKELQEELPKGAIMAYEVAEKELEKWFDFRKVKDAVRDSPDDTLGYDPNRRTLIEGFMFGMLKINSDNGILTQTLEWPPEKEKGGVLFSEMNWKPRIKERDLTEPMKGVKPKDSSGRIKAHISAFTSIDKNWIGSLDYSSDYSLAQSIVTYFLL